MKTRIAIQCEPFDAAAEIAGLSDGAGAVATFTGFVRREGDLATLRLEHYPGMTEREIARHIGEAQARWPLLAATVVHRVGSLKPGEPIVFVGTAALHRREAFAACEFLMDYLKTRAPFWKEETRAGVTRWVDAKATDDHAAARWKQ
ncbi:MAG: molybdenum cofactor biosynthesis protein MoaE [Alphaproteobacteria bacterium]|nr:molybdenum cofactor biosynthesis protein MoaE [Alphaproteobacteria bacterium]